METSRASTAFLVNYTNWKGQTRLRRIRPLHVHFGSTSHHREEQWLLKCIDLETDETHDFAISRLDLPPGGEDSQKITELFLKYGIILNKQQ